MTHNCFGSNYTKLVVSFLFTLKLHCHHLFDSLNEFEVLLLGELKTCDFVMQHADVFQQVLVRVVLHNISLMAQSDSSEKLYDHLLISVRRTRKNQVSLLIMELGGKFKFVW